MQILYIVSFTFDSTEGNWVDLYKKNVAAKRAYHQLSFSIMFLFFLKRPGLCINQLFRHFPAFVNIFSLFRTEKNIRYQLTKFHTDFQKHFIRDPVCVRR